MPKLFITKRQLWTDRTGRVIEQSTWTDIVEDADSFHIRDINNPGRTLIRRDFFENRDRFTWRNGNVEVDCNGPAVAELALEFSNLIGASVQGVLGEHYYLDSEGYVRHIWPELGLPRPEERYEQKRLREKRQNMLLIPFALLIVVLLGISSQLVVYTNEPSIMERPVYSQQERELIEIGAAIVRAELEKARMSDPNAVPTNDELYEYIQKKHRVDRDGVTSRLE